MADHHRIAGHLGGTATYQKYGREGMARAGTRGGRPRALSLSELRQQQASQQIKEGGNLEGELAGKTPSNNNLTMLKKEWLQQAGRACEILIKSGEGLVELSPGS